MKKFIYSSLLFSLSLFLVIILIISCYVYKYHVSINDLPAPNFSTSYSFNEKMQFLKNRLAPIKTLAIGSSMTLNNLHSKTVIKETRNTDFFNAASWGMSMEENYNLLKTLSAIYHPQKIIIASGIIDFIPNSKNIDYCLLSSYLRNDNTLNAHLTHFNSQYYFHNFKYAQQVRQDSLSYEYLGFDQYGAVNFNDKGFKISANRFHSDFTENSTNKIEYLYLDSIASYCENQKMKLLFFSTPIRVGLYNKLNEKKLVELKMHLQKVKSIIQRHGHQFVDVTTAQWNDYLFVDGTHLNTKGAELFTTYCFENIH